MNDHNYRRIMEDCLGRKLLSTEVVHHLNRDHFDNRKENLKVCESDLEHSSLHRIVPGYDCPICHHASCYARQTTHDLKCLYCGAIGYLPSNYSPATAPKNKSFLCPKCNIRWSYIRFKTKELVCRRCGSVTSLSKCNDDTIPLANPTIKSG